TTSALLVDAGQRGELAEPRQLRAQPDLTGGTQLLALIDRAGTDAVDPRLGAGSRGVDRRAAGLAECLVAPGPVLRGLGVDARGAGDDPEAARSGADRHPERSPREDLAVRAMADPGGCRIDLGLVANRPTVAATGDVHLSWMHWIGGSVQSRLPGPVAD